MEALTGAQKSAERLASTVSQPEKALADMARRHKVRWQEFFIEADQGTWWC